MTHIRQQYSEKYLQGRGVEFGALHNPLHTPKQSQVLYADRFSKEELIRRFPELAEYAKAIVTTDIRLDLDCADFSSLIEYRFDFFIANHVIEHLTNPIRFLKQIHDVMKEGAILYLAVPDKNYTFDKNRKRTTNEHLWRDYEGGETELSIDHLNDFILNITKDHIEPERKKKMYFKNDALPLNWFRKRSIYQLHRKRSIHVHVWDQKTFDEFLHCTTEKLELKFTIIDSSRSDNNESNEMIYILKKNS